MRGRQGAILPAIRHGELPDDNYRPTQRSDGYRQHGYPSVVRALFIIDQRRPELRTRGIKPGAGTVESVVWVAVAGDRCGSLRVVVGDFRRR